MNEDVKHRIQSLIDGSPVLLFMKGNKLMPMCGFSATVVSILQEIGAPFQTVDVLQDPDLREGIKAFSNWPTIPQLYVGGQFVGGCDIIREMYERGEVQPLIRGAVPGGA